MAQAETDVSEQAVGIQQPEKPLSNILVAIPAYNEEVAIGSVVLSVKQETDNVLVVDDGSADATAEIAREAGAAVIEHGTNRGKGAAIRTIFNEFEAGDHDALVLLDGDGQHMPGDIPDVVEPVLDADSDMVIGSRYLEGDEDDETPLYRRFGQKTLDVLTTGSTNSSLTDTQSGFRAFSPEAVESMTIGTDGIGVESEMIDTASQNGLELSEVPINVKYEEVDGQTYNPLRHGLSVVAFILQLVRDRHPMVFFGLPGLLLLGFGAVLGLHTSWLYQTTGAFHQWRVLISGFSILLGTLSLFCGLVLNQVANMIGQVDQ